MSAVISLHHCTGIKIVSRWPQNANQITLDVDTKGGAKVEITLFNLHAEATEALMAAFGDQHTQIIDETPPYLTEAAR